jgi:hypothetical protein
VLIGNTGGDRLIDWAGEFNSFLVPFAPFGAAAVSRSLQPQLPEYLYALSASDGADPTLGSTRNGEPGGELGLVLQQDTAWQSQTGGPRDPQPGNIGGGTRDVLRSADFDSGTMQGFYQVSGSTSVSDGRLQLASTSQQMDALAVTYTDNLMPQSFQIGALVNMFRGSGAAKGNAYIIFDYQSPTNFKFAGINGSTNKLEIGYRDERGWFVSAQSSVAGGIHWQKDYQLVVSINANSATLTVGSAKVSHTFQARADSSGVQKGITAGLIGVAVTEGRSSFDNVIVWRDLP